MKKLLLSAIISILMLPATALASSFDTVEYNVSSKTLQVSGIADKSADSGLQMVTLRVFKPGSTAESIKSLSNEEKKNAVVFVKQTERQSDGRFSFTYAPSEIEYGNYKIYVTDPNGEVLEKYVLFLDTAKNTELLGDLNAAASKTAMKAALQKHSYIIDGVEAVDEIKQALPDVDLFDSVAEMLAGERFADAASAVDEVVGALVVTAINNAENADKITEIINKYNKELGFSENKIYTELYLSFPQKVSVKFVGKGYKTVDGFVTDFCDTVILDKINAINNYTAVMPVLDAGREYLTGFKFTKYDALSDTQKAYVQKEVINTLEKSSYSKVSDLQKIFNDAVDNAPDTDVINDSGRTEKSSRTGGSSSSSDKVSSSGGNIGVAKITQPDGAKKDTFTDLSSAEWARESILALYEKGIVSGMGDNKFEPSALVTREQFAKMIITACGLYSENSDCEFEDVGADKWYYNYVAAAVGAGVVYGISDKLFGAGYNITREDMAVMAFRAARLNTQNGGAIYSDDEAISDYASPAVYTLQDLGVMSGRGDNKFEPKAFATRAEAARMIYGLINLTKGAND